ncbi:SRPBCC domain-containing protein [Sphingosinicella sp. CPCC 101087]|uniref:SRPBCC domain-containing protein n=1 Tax=Sphingosinicella sp. CPCC 101087 TaxID=2497754 RepID=UPI00101C2E59
MSIVEGTVDLTRHFALPVETVFAAWAREQAQLTWGDPGEGWEMTFDQFRFAVGHSDVCRFGPVGGQQYINEVRYLAIEPSKRIVCTTSLSCNGRVNFAGTLAVAFEEVGGGTRMRLMEHGLYFDGRDDVAGHRSGWESMLDALGEYLTADSERSSGALVGD